ncbi:MAG: hypothetical protein K0B02_03245 [DPANN group archaeon]|nr:hypothetical protein [DPANN group archaeon]
MALEYEDVNEMYDNARPLLVKVMDKGHNISEIPELKTIQNTLQTELSRLTAEYKTIRNPKICC